MPRIIAGALGGRFVPGPPGRGTRPTADRVREALFSRLDGWDTLQGGRVLDLFAGTGVLSFESISRGAEDAVMVEMHAPTARALCATAKELGIAQRSEEHTSELQSRGHLVCRLLLEKKKTTKARRHWASASEKHQPAVGSSPEASDA